MQCSLSSLDNKGELTNYFESVILCFDAEFSEVKHCVQAGGSIKDKCSSNERQVAGGCKTGHFCCCALKDGV